MAVAREAAQRGRSRSARAPEAGAGAPESGCLSWNMFCGLFLSFTTCRAHKPQSRSPGHRLQPSIQSYTYRNAATGHGGRVRVRGARRV